MNYQEAKEILKIPASLAMDWNKRYRAMAFIEGWDAHREFGAQLNGKPDEPYVHENGVEEDK